VTHANTKRDKEKVGAVIVAAGRSERMGGADKIFAGLCGEPLLAHTVAAFHHSSVIDCIVVVLAQDRVKDGRDMSRKLGWTKVVSICAGGARRQDSVREGIKRIENVSWVMIHDGARPCVTGDMIERGLRAAAESGSAIPAIPASDTIKVVSSDSYIVDTPQRDGLYAVQTPQVFRFDIISAAHRIADDDATDDAVLAERAGYRVKIFQGSGSNIKVTTKEDLVIAEAIIKSRTKKKS